MGQNLPGCLYHLVLISGAHSWAPKEKGVLGRVFCAVVLLAGAEMAAGWRKLLATSKDSQGRGQPQRSPGPSWLQYA